MTDKNKPAPRSQMWCDNPGNCKLTYLGLVRRPLAGLMSVWHEKGRRYR